METPFRTTEVTPAFGVEIHGIDLRAEQPAEIIDALRAVYDEHHMLMFRGIELSAEDQMRVMSWLGPLCQEQIDGRLYSFVSNRGEANVPGCNALPLHSDVTYTPFGGIHIVSLYGMEVQNAAPTLFAGAARAARRLPAALRARLEGRRVLQVYDFSGGYTHDHRMRLKDFPPDPPLSIYPRWDHPVIDRLPRTGVEFVGINDMHSSHILGMPDDESEALLEEIKAILYAPDNMYAHTWRPHDLLIWSNLALQHGRPVHDKPDLRLLRRVSVNPVAMYIAHAGVEISGISVEGALKTTEIAKARPSPAS